MGSNVAVMNNPEETVLDLFKQIDRGHMVLDVEQACKEVVGGCREHMKSGEVTLKIKFDPDPKTGAMRVSYDLKKKVPEKKPMASIFFVCDDNTLSRQDPRQREMFDANTGEVHGGGYYHG